MKEDQIKKFQRNLMLKTDNLEQEEEKKCAKVVKETQIGALTRTI